MELKAVELGPALGLLPCEHLAIVGAGGKSSLLVELSRDRRRAGARVVAATTTKVWHRQALRAGRLVLTEESGWRDRLDRELEAGQGVFIGGRLLPTGKVEGIRPELADELFLSGTIDYLIVEADGAAGRPLKAPRPGEPVVPASATRVVAMAGLEALGKPMGHEHVHRMERFAEVAGVPPGAILSAKVLSRVFDHPAGLFQGAPEGARRTAFLNQLDLVADLREAHALARAILDRIEARVHEVVLGSLRRDRYFSVPRT